MYFKSYSLSAVGFSCWVTWAWIHFRYVQSNLGRLGMSWLQKRSTCLPHLPLCLPTKQKPLLCACGKNQLFPSSGTGNHSLFILAGPLWLSIFHQQLLLMATGKRVYSGLLPNAIKKQFKLQEVQWLAQNHLKHGKFRDWISIPPGCFRGEYGPGTLWDGIPNQMQIRALGKSMCRQSLCRYYVNINRSGVDIIDM